MDNVTAVIIGFEGFERYLNYSSEQVDYRPTAHSVSPKRNNEEMLRGVTYHNLKENDSIPPSQRATPKRTYGLRGLN